MKTFHLLFFLFFSCASYAQLLTITPGSSLNIMSGTIFTIEKLSLIPNNNFTLTENLISNSQTTFHPGINPNIHRVYRFQNSTHPYNGTILFQYNDGTELNNIPENTLTLNIHNGNHWNAFSPSLRDALGNIIVTTVKPYPKSGQFKIRHFCKFKLFNYEKENLQRKQNSLCSQNV